jgi:hypothetical protein
MMALIEGAQGQQTGIAGDLAPGKIGADGLMMVEGEKQFGIQSVTLRMLRKGVLDSRKPSVHQSFRASFLFLPDKS